MAQVGYDIRETPGFVILTASRHGEEMTAGGAEDLANKLLEAAKHVREHNRQRPK